MEKLTRKVERVNGHGLELYHSYQSFYSQKVVFTLNEKKLTFQSKILDIYKFEQYEQWYLKLNPRAEVPVLKDEVKIIPDSTRIIDYLEDNFSNGDIPRLTPEKGTDQWVKMKNLREMLDNVPIKLLTFGTLWHPDQTDKSRTCITDAQRKQKLSLFDSLPMKLDELIKLYPEYSQPLREKKANLQDCLEIKDLGKFKKLLAELDDTLDIVEKEIESGSKDNPNWWLCSENFTLADISLIMLLGRLKYLGLLDRYATKRPALKKYFCRAQLRDSYKKATRRGSITVLDKMPCKHILSYALGSIVLLGLLVTATILYKRLK